MSGLGDDRRLVPLGMDGAGRPYAELADALLRVGPDGGAQWRLPLGGAVVDGDDVWVAQPAAPGGEVVARSLTGHGTVALAPGEGAWRLAGRAGEDGFVLHDPGDHASPGRLVTATAGGFCSEPVPAPHDVWLQWYDLQPPRGPAVTAAGEIDLAIRGPEALYVVRLTPQG